MGRAHGMLHGKGGCAKMHGAGRETWNGCEEWMRVLKKD